MKKFLMKLCLNIVEVLEWKDALNNKIWSLDADRDIMQWTISYPQDWQVGGKCEAYFWGNGRHGQLAEGGKFCTYIMFSFT